MWQDNAEMNCREVARRLDAFADGHLTAAERNQIDLHLAGCGQCRLECESIAKLKSRLKTAVNSQSVPVELGVRIRAGLQESRRVSPGSPRWVLAAAAAVVLAVSTWATLEFTGMRRQAFAMLEIGAGDHIHCTLERKSAPGSFQSELTPMGAN